MDQRLHQEEPIFYKIQVEGYLSGALSTPRKGAATAIYLSTTGEAYENGRYWASEKQRAPNPLMDDAALGARCWRESLRLCCLALPGCPAGQGDAGEAFGAAVI